jgi:membrane protein DedA with SNARE-associated domain
MIWVPMVGLAVGALLAQRFKIVALLPATLAIAVLAFAVATARTSSALATILIIVATSVCMQAGYFVGMLLRRGVGGASRLSSFSQTKSARDPAR